MRYICAINGVVGCTMRAIQFHKYLGAINKDDKGAFNICYPLDDKDGTIGLQYFQNQRGEYSGNICCNPPVNYPILGEHDYEDQISDVIGYFIEFINNQQEICEKLEKYQWKYNPISEKNKQLKKSK